MIIVLSFYLTGDPRTSKNITGHGSVQILPKKEVDQKTKDSGRHSDIVKSMIQK